MIVSMEWVDGVEEQIDRQTYTNRDRHTCTEADETMKRREARREEDREMEEEKEREIERR